MLTIMVFAVLLGVSDAAAEHPRVTPDDVWNHLWSATKPCVLAAHPEYRPKSASIILRGSGGEYLLFQEKNKKFGYPGGNVDYADPKRPLLVPDESDFGAALREFEEETGFPLLEMIAQSVNSYAAARKQDARKTTLGEMVVGRRLTPTREQDKKDKTKMNMVPHQVFLIHVNCPLVNLLTLYKGYGSMSSDPKRIGDEDRARQIERAGWSTYAVGAKAKRDRRGKREGEIVAIATLKQMTNAHNQRTIMRGGKYYAKTETKPATITPGPYLRMLKNCE